MRNNIEERGGNYLTSFLFDNNSAETKKDIGYTKNSYDTAERNEVVSPKHLLIFPFVDIVKPTAVGGRVIVPEWLHIQIALSAVRKQQTRSKERVFFYVRIRSWS
ncbi:hypothetical protein CN495_08065 [Bacillus thuringiensis]|uniref:Uncharacterized protein n=1 Tax=Bacillus thuringiensis TaxID=1428 RepID=A0ABD6SAI5_BACTU|nr:hypothetical protein [Bacillus thuringiensis]PER55698.1 hypothetical protein CN495_08065 [Bacillus thuringiensis]